MITNLSLEEAVRLIQQHVEPLEPVLLYIDQAKGRILAEDIMAPMDQPPFDRSPVDGYAILSSDTVGATRETPVRLTLVDTVCAGQVSSVTLKSGQCIRIMTGAKIPSGADGVIRQESTDMGEQTVEIYEAIKHYGNYVFRGEDYKTGDILLPKGTRLDAAALAVLASAGFACELRQVLVNAVPKVAVLCTGDELVYPYIAPLPDGKIYDANLTFLTTRLADFCVHAESGGEHFGDDPQLVADSIRQVLLWADAVITTGGVSVGMKDIFHEVLPLLEAEQIFTHLQMKPGTPAIFSMVRDTPVLCLSGNPFAAAATFELLARPMLEKLSGDKALATHRIAAELASDFPKASGGRRFIRGTYDIDTGTITLGDAHSSGQLRSMAGCNCLVDIPAGSGPLEAGATVSAVLL